MKSAMHFVGERAAGRCLTGQPVMAGFLAVFEK